MSRLILKNLPNSTTAPELKAHLTQTGSPAGLTITDLKIATKGNGSSRQFAFVGYRTEEEAEKARAWFDRTYLGTSRIRVDVVQDGLERPRKRRRLGNAGEDEKSTRKILKEKNDKKQKKEEKDTKKKGQLDEFMDVMKPRTKSGPSWANESQPEAPVPVVEVEHEENEEVQEEGISDMDWMRRRMANAEADAGQDAAFVQDDEEKATPLPGETEEKDPTKQTILSTSRLFVRNLAYSCTEADLQALFERFGNVSQVHISVDPTTSRSKGFAYITFSSPQDALRAYEELDRTTFQGRILHVLGAVDREGQKFEVQEAHAKKNASLKDERSATKKKLAGKDFNWSMLYMNSDAVATSIADRMSIPKSSILGEDDTTTDAKSTNPAVKLALAETHVINETKTYLESQGVDLAAFAPSTTTAGPPRKRSNTVVLVKNIPYGTSPQDIQSMFAQGNAGELELKRVVVPPAGTIAVVEYAQPDEAREGFRRNAYRRVGSGIVYLEWGYEGMFSSSSSSSGLPGTSTSGGEGKKRKADTVESAANTVDDDHEPEEQRIEAGTTLYIKNLAFATTSARLSQSLSSLPGFSYARIATKPNPQSPSGPQLSAGYGFVGFKDGESARGALRSLDGFALDGRVLEVKPAGRGREDEDAAETQSGKSKTKGTGSKKTTKMIVKNVPFETSKKDLRDLFSAHGSLRSLRLPRKSHSPSTHGSGGGRGRGFAFLDFMTRQDAENAMEKMRHTHLLGRHLVLEWAQDDGEDAEERLEELRRRTGIGMGAGASGGRKTGVNMDVLREGEEE